MKSMPNRLLAVAVTVVLAPVAPAPAADPTLDLIMRRDVAGTQPENPRWSDDGRTIHYELRRPGTEIVDLWRVDVASGRTSRVEDRERGQVDPPRAVWSRDRKLKAFVRDGDLFLRDARGALRQVTRTVERESDPLLLLDGRVAFRRGDAFFAFDPASGTTATLAELRFADDPEAEKPKGFYEEQQQRYFQVLREAKARQDEKNRVDEERRRADPTRAPKPWYLGKGQALQDAALSPNGRHLALVVGAARDRSEDLEQGADGGTPDKLPVFVTESGYVEIREVRPKVGTGKPQSPKLLLLDLAAGERRELDYGALPGLREDPLAALRAAAAAARGEASGSDTPAVNGGAVAAKGPQPRVVATGTPLWNEEGTRFALQFFSYDNKDRWLVAVEAATGALTPLERTHDPAWIGWRFNDFGWMRDGATLWYLSEESGHSHLYLRPLAGTKRQLTSGPFEVDAPILARDGRSFFVSANREHPGIVEAYRVDARSGALTRLTQLGGMLERATSGGRGWGADLVLAPDERQLAFLVSRTLEPPQLYVQALRPGAAARRLTDTVAPEWRAIDWARPEVVAIPSSKGAGNVWARVYTPAGWTPEGRYPAVAFVHGAGYLQNVHYGWSLYHREMMFHTLLVRRGYVVIDMDYRGSSGYGRDWRTAIYRQMGWPEVEDYEDGIAWLVANRSVDPTRVGVYGGSYGGFFAFMALFTKPDLFAAGAALRPVTDWAHYNHGYTSNILNTPEVDPEAYRKSSPIEHAEGLRKPLLILHGMVDDNVVFQDSVRLVQRLIELGKTDYFETAIYPVESHAFREPASWVDEYRRIWNLFERTLW
jgi:dipeptidyl aminopeptidase/acylaminoacyl peptidase